MAADQWEPGRATPPTTSPRSVRFVTDGRPGGEAAALIAGITDDEADADVAEPDVRPGSKGWNHTA
jgi:hypothetical protein